MYSLILTQAICFPWFDTLSCTEKTYNNIMGRRGLNYLFV